MVRIERMLRVDDISDLGEASYEDALQEASAWARYRAAEDDRDLTYPGSWDVPDLVDDFRYRKDGAERHEKRSDVVADVVDKRQEKLPDMDVEMPTDGRILAVFVDQSLSDGAGAAVSDEFLSASNLPPADTWVAYITEDLSRRHSLDRTGILLSYILEEYVEEVQAGIDVNPEECLLWVGDYTFPSP